MESDDIQVEMNVRFQDLIDEVLRRHGETADTVRRIYEWVDEFVRDAADALADDPPSIDGIFCPGFSLGVSKQLFEAIEQVKAELHAEKVFETSVNEPKVKH